MCVYLCACYMYIYALYIDYIPGHSWKPEKEVRYPVRLLFSWFPERVSYWTWTRLAWLPAVSPSDSFVFPSPTTLRLQTHLATSHFLFECQGFELGSSRLHSKHCYPLSCLSQMPGKNFNMSKAKRWSYLWYTVIDSECLQILQEGKLRSDSNGTSNLLVFCSVWLFSIWWWWWWSACHLPRQSGHP